MNRRATGGGRQTGGVGREVVATQPVESAIVQEIFEGGLGVIFQRQRFYARYPVEMDVAVKFPKKLLGKGVNIGEGGIAVQLPEKIEVAPDEFVHISFAFPASDEKFEDSAKLAWMNNDLQAA